MNHPQWAWLPDEEPTYILECWLRTQSSTAAITLLATPARAEAARALLKTAPAGAKVTVLDSSESPCLKPGPEQPCLVIPVALDMVPMRYRPTLMPDLPPHYLLLRQAWQWGFRWVRFVGLHTEHTLPIPHLLEGFHNRHQGERCFVVGNGPSLNNIDMTRLRGEITFGANRCFLGYESWGFPFTYWGVYDKYQIEMYHQEYEDRIPSDTVKFFPVEYLPAFHVANGCPVQSIWPTGGQRAFSADAHQTTVGFTVTFMLLQIAAAMGCDPIILVGVDHRYELNRRGYIRLLRQLRRTITGRLRGGPIYNATQAAHRAWKKHGRSVPGTPALWSTDDAASPTHFTGAYTAGGKHRFLPPEPEEAERDFDCAEVWAKKQGRRILNATPDTALDSFPKVPFDDLF